MLNSIVFFCVALDQQYKLSNYIKMPTSIMFGDEVGEKLWATLDNSFRSFFQEYREIYAPSDKTETPQSSGSQQQTSKTKVLMRHIVAQQMSNIWDFNVSAKFELDKYLQEDNEEDKKGLTSSSIGRTMLRDCQYYLT